MASSTYNAATSAFELEIAGIIFPAISLILNLLYKYRSGYNLYTSMGIEKLKALMFVAAETKSIIKSSSLLNVIDPTKSFLPS